MERVTVSGVRVARWLTGEHQGHQGRSLSTVRRSIHPERTRVIARLRDWNFPSTESFPFHRWNGRRCKVARQISQVEYNTITRVLEFVLVKNHWPMKQKSSLNDDKFLLLSFSLPSSVPPTTGTHLNAVGSRRWIMRPIRGKLAIKRRLLVEKGNLRRKRKLVHPGWFFFFFFFTNISTFLFLLSHSSILIFTKKRTSDIYCTADSENSRFRSILHANS